MGPTIFKLSKQSLIRKIAFESAPSWFTLASRIEPLYGIPVDKVGVSYVDSDGDEVTLSSDEELQEFYNGILTPPQVIKFVVQDLRTLRQSQDPASKSLPVTPQVTNPRNTFGGVEGIPLMFDMEDDWQRLPTNLFRRESPHAFVEVVDSDVVSNHKADQSDTKSSTGSDLVDVTTQSTQKGKGRAYRASVSDSISSTGSVLAEVAPSKRPDHVFDIGLHNQSRVSTPAHTVRSVGAGSHHSTAVSAVAESTPKATVQALGDADPSASTQTAEEAIPDPPLPTLEPLPGQHNVSLSNDVASLLNTLTNVISSHPELSEGFQNIVRNTANGSYWTVHREAMSRAAEEIMHAREGTGRMVEGLARTAEDVRRNAEQEAGRRVAEALGGIFRVISGVTGNAGTTAAANETTLPAQWTNWCDFPANHGRPGVRPTSFKHHCSGFQHGDELRPLPPTFSDPWAVHHPFNRPPWRSSWRHLPPAPPPPPPPPPPFGLHPGPLPPSFSAAQSPAGLTPQAQEPLPPVQSPPFIPPFYPTFPPPGSHPPPPPATGPLPFVSTPRGAWGGWSEPYQPVQATSQELRAQVELAKSRYKAEKERYREERDKRKKERHETTLATAGEGPQEAGEASTAQIISNARGPYPQLEMVSVPRRYNTYSGPPTRRGAADGVEGRAMHRISRRLADMGFTENAYPSLPAKIKAQLPPSGIIEKDKEDDIVTTLLEELLSVSPKLPAASGSGVRKDRDIPGAWH